MSLTEKSVKDRQLYQHSNSVSILFMNYRVSIWRFVVNCHVVPIKIPSLHLGFLSASQFITSTKVWSWTISKVCGNTNRYPINYKLNWKHPEKGYFGIMLVPLIISFKECNPFERTEVFVEFSNKSVKQSSIMRGKCYFMELWAYKGCSTFWNQGGFLILRRQPLFYFTTFVRST